MPTPTSTTGTTSLQLRAGSTQHRDVVHTCAKRPNNHRRSHTRSRHHTYLTVKRLDFLGPGNPMPDGIQEIAESEAIRQSLTLQGAIEVFEKQFLIKMLEQHHWQKNRTAQALGIERKTLYRKMKKFGLG